MKHKIEIFLAVTAIAIGIAAILLTNGNRLQPEFTPLPENETTLRNVTQEDITYWVKPQDPTEKPDKKSLKAGKLHHFPGQETINIMFTRLGWAVTRSLKPRTPYSFRYDKNGRIQVYKGSHGRADAEDLAPFVATPMPIVKKMLEMAEVDSSDILFDLGCGDGRIVITAAKKYGTQGVGIDIDPQRIRESKSAAKKAGVGKLAKFRLADATRVNISKATIITLYLLPESNELLRPRLEKQLKPGVLVVSHNYRIRGWEGKEIDSFTMQDLEGKDHTIYLYEK